MMGNSEMKKIEKYLKYAPLIYALYLPLNFFVHIFGMYSGCIMPFFMYALDFLRVLFIASFAYYLAKTYTLMEKMHPGENMMIFAGVAFLEWIVNVVISDVYAETYYEHKYFYIFFGITTLVGYFFETKTFCKIAKIFDDATSAGWIGYNGLVLGICYLTYRSGGKGASKVIIGLIVFRSLMKYAFINLYVKKQSEPEAASLENADQGE